MNEIKSTDINDVLVNINLAMNNIVKKYSYLQLNEHSKETLISSKKLLQSGQNLYKQIKSHLAILSESINECELFIEEIEDDLSEKRKKENFVYKTANGMLSYPGRDFVDNVKQSPIIKEQLTDKLITIGNIQMKFPVVNNLKKIPPMFYYYYPDNDVTKTSATDKNSNNKVNNVDQEGLYCCIGSNIYVQIPFPVIIDSSKDLNRDYSIKCKYRTRAICTEQREKMAMYHNSIVRKCNFAHEGEHLNKIGYSTRCAIIPNIGNPETLDSDLKSVGLDSIKNILLYGLNDVAIASLWFDKNKVKKLTLNNLDIA
jgi:hypothetical protein